MSRFASAPTSPWRRGGPASRTQRLCLTEIDERALAGWHPIGRAFHEASSDRYRRSLASWVDPFVTSVRASRLWLVGEQVVAVPGEACRGDRVVAVVAGDELVDADSAELRVRAPLVVGGEHEVEVER